MTTTIEAGRLGLHGTQKNDDNTLNKFVLLPHESDTLYADGKDYVKLHGVVSIDAVHGSEVVGIVSAPDHAHIVIKQVALFAQDEKTEIILDASSFGEEKTLLIRRRDFAKGLGVVVSEHREVDFAVFKPGESLKTGDIRVEGDGIFICTFGFDNADVSQAPGKVQAWRRIGTVPL